MSKNKGERLDPKSYLSKEYIDSHIAKFDGGVTKFRANAPFGDAGPAGGTFVMPKSVAENLIAQSGGDINKLEQLLGLGPGDLGNNPVRIDISKPKGLRIPSGNEFGANTQWLPGGFTSGGITEAVIDSPSIGEYVVNYVYQ